MKKFLILALVALSIPFGSEASTNLIKGQSFDSVYYVGNDNKRYVFPNLSTYNSWYTDFAEVATVPDEQLYSLQIGGNVTYKPGSLVKVTTDPKVYAVDKGGVLRWVQGEELAKQVFGEDWAKKVSDVPDMFFFNYRVGAPIAATSDFAPLAFEGWTIVEDKSAVGGAVEAVAPVAEPVKQVAEAKPVEEVKEAVKPHFTGEPIFHKNGYNEGEKTYIISFTPRFEGASNYAVKCFVGDDKTGFFETKSLENKVSAELRVGGERNFGIKRACEIYLNIAKNPSWDNYEFAKDDSGNILKQVVEFTPTK